MAALEAKHFFAPLTFQEFYTRHFLGGEPLVRRGSPDEFAALASLPELANAEALCNAMRQGTSLFGPKGFHSKLSVGTEALPFYRAGYTIYARNAELSIAALGELSGDLARAFGCGAAYAEVFSSQTNAGATMHYDFDINFQVLLRGKKRWRIGENRQFPNPLTSLFVLDEGSRHSGIDSLFFDKQSAPRKMPADALEFVAEPGTVVFLPRGAWHETLSLQESMAINFVLKPPIWARATADLIFSKLIRSAEWRGYPVGALGTDLDADGGDAPAALKQARAMLRKLRKIAQGLTAEELLVAPHSTLYRWVPGSRRQVQAKGRTSILVVRFADGKPTLRIELERAAVPFVKRLVKRDRAFLTEQVLPDLGRVSAHFAVHLLQQLKSFGVLSEVKQ